MANEKTYTFRGKYVLTGKVYAITGLHIGGSKEGFEIGGVDNPVIRDPMTDYPYIPGSSLKGKLRAMLEWADSKVLPHPDQKGNVYYPPCDCGQCDVCRLFGTSAEAKTSGPTRLIVRDAMPIETTVAEWKQLIGSLYTEVKTENAIDRITSEAKPRQMERVPAGSFFSFQMLIDDYAVTEAASTGDKGSTTDASEAEKEQVTNGDRAFLQKLFLAMHLLEESTLGGSGSRGSGRIRFVDLTLHYRSRDRYYKGKGEADKLFETKKTVDEILKDPKWRETEVKQSLVLVQLNEIIPLANFMVASPSPLAGHSILKFLYNRWAEILNVQEQREAEIITRSKAA